MKAPIVDANDLERASVCSRMFDHNVLEIRVVIRFDFPGRGLTVDDAIDPLPIRFEGKRLEDRSRQAVAAFCHVACGRLLVQQFWQRWYDATPNGAGDFSPFVVRAVQRQLAMTNVTPRATAALRSATSPSRFLPEDAETSRRVCAACPTSTTQRASLDGRLQCRRPHSDPKRPASVPLVDVGRQFCRLMASRSFMRCVS